MLARISLGKVQCDGLDKTFNAHFTISLHKLHEGCFVLGPILNHIAFALKQTAKEEVILVLDSYVQDQLQMTHVGQQLFASAFRFVQKHVHVQNFTFDFWGIQGHRNSIQHIYFPAIAF